MLKFSEIFEFSGENSYFERIRMVRMVRMVRSLADRTFQLWLPLLPGPGLAGRGDDRQDGRGRGRRREVRAADAVALPPVAVGLHLCFSNFYSSFPLIFGKLLSGSFSAGLGLSKPNFASKYSVESS